MNVSVQSNDWENDERNARLCDIESTCTCRRAAMQETGDHVCSHILVYVTLIAIPYCGEIFTGVKFLLDLLSISYRE